jgi:HSP20 family molecular chaperone IbpA
MEEVINNWHEQTKPGDQHFGVPMNIRESDKAYELHVMAAGLKKEDFQS